MEHRKIRAIVSGGGTGGHIFPALSIAGSLKKMNPESEIIFVGALGRMEMEKVPAAGYKIYGLDISGLKRSLSADNLKLPFKYLKAIKKAGDIIDEFKPDICIGVGGYCSAPLLWAAQRKGIPTLIQEQNGFAGLANKILSKKAGCICVAYDGMERFFPADKIVLSGNPIRGEIVPATPETKAEAIEYYKLDPSKKHIFIVGGSLGSRTLNESVKKWIEDGCPGGGDIEILWQCGKYYKASIDEWMAGRNLPLIHHTDFIKRMDLAYAMADLVVSRSGASSISELCAAHKATIFVPSPNVTEDHQTHNAMALVRKDAAILIKDDEAPSKLMAEACRIVHDEEKIRSMEENAGLLARTDAADVIAEEVYKLI